MKTSRIALFAFAAIVGLGSLVGSAQPSHAYVTDFSWASNKGYVNCVSGVNQRAAAMNPRDRAAYANNGRQGCNRIFYGHN